ncbi:MAG: dihydrodipicolinate synthase family protein [Chloroflexi bacterium]|nr:dihydrodipicolinate synthase family protein [Chloroflexota bacterium]
MPRKIGDKVIEGVGVLMTTPLKNDYTLNEDSVRKQVDWCFEKGAVSMWPCGYIGEWPQLDTDLRKRYFEVTVDQANGRGWVAAGCHSTNLNTTVELVNHAEKVGCDLAWICAVTLRRPTEADLVSQYKYILERTSLPLAVYNSYPTGVYMRAETMVKIAQLSDRIVAIKDSVGDFAHIATVYHAGLGNMVSFFGTGYIMMPHMVFGAAGALASPFTVPMARAAYDAFKEKNWDRAWALQSRMTNERPLLTYPAIAEMTPGAKVTSSHMGYHKAKTSVVTGIEMGPPAPPYAPATEAEMKDILENVKEFNPLQP